MNRLELLGDCRLITSFVVTEQTLKGSIYCPSRRRRPIVLVIDFCRSLTG